VNFGFPLSLSFEVTASTTGGKNFAWRAWPGGTDVLTPASGTISGSGVTHVTLSDLVLGDSVTIEVTRGDKTHLIFTLKH
jgi:hypothetical protein